MRVLFRWLVLFLPAFWLLVEVSAAPKESMPWLGIGAGLCLFVALLLMFLQRGAPPARLSATLLPSLGFLWLLAIKPEGDPLIRSITEAVFVLMPVLGVMGFWINRSGALTYRRARKISDKLTHKVNWPEDLSLCKDLPEVHEFREAIQFDAGPALDLLEHAHPGVRIVALSAMEYRQHWRLGQMERILRLLEGERTPEVRIAAIAAIAAVRDRKSTEAIAATLSDPDDRVREIACHALFFKADRRSRDRRWQWMRNNVRLALSANFLSDTGPILREGQILSPEAVVDFVAWVADRGSLGVRAAETLAVHFSRLLREDSEETARELTALVEEPKTPAILRIQLAKLLSSQYKGDLKLMEKLLNAGNPVPLRQMAAETLLTRTGRHPEALGALREIARLGNRELALDTARIVQQCLNIDLGLAVGQPIPHPGSPRAADITRKLLQWAMQSEPSQNAIDLGGSRSHY